MILLGASVGVYGQAVEDGAVEAQNLFTDGYRGYAEYNRAESYSPGIGIMELNTSHGLQFCPEFFMGMGLGLHLMDEFKEGYMSDGCYVVRDFKASIPLYLNCRVRFSKNIKSSPIADLKVGKYLNNHDGLFLSVGSGIRFQSPKKRKFAGYVLFQFTVRNLSALYVPENPKEESFMRGRAKAGWSCGIGMEF